MKMESFAVGYRQQSSTYNMTWIIVFKRFKLKLWHVTKIAWSTYYAASIYVLAKILHLVYCYPNTSF